MAGDKSPSATCHGGVGTWRQRNMRRLSAAKAGAVPLRRARTLKLAPKAGHLKQGECGYGYGHGHAMGREHAYPIDDSHDAVREGRQLSLLASLYFTRLFSRCAWLDSFLRAPGGIRLLAAHWRFST